MEAVHAESDYVLLSAQQMGEVVSQASLPGGIRTIDGHSHRVCHSTPPEVVGQAHGLQTA
jgi:hypothetical protein